VDLSGVSNTVDLLVLVQALNNGSAGANLARYDVNRSGVVNTVDLLRVVQLLNGTGTSDAFNVKTVAACPPERRNQELETRNGPPGALLVSGGPSAYRPCAHAGGSLCKLIATGAARTPVFVALPIGRAVNLERWGRRRRSSQSRLLRKSTDPGSPGSRHISGAGQRQAARPRRVVCGPAPVDRFSSPAQPSSWRRIEAERGVPPGHVVGLHGAGVREPMRIIQLINGVNTTQAFNGQNLAPCP